MFDFLVAIDPRHTLISCLPPHLLGHTSLCNTSIYQYMVLPFCHPWGTTLISKPFLPHYTAAHKLHHNHCHASSVQPLCVQSYFRSLTSTQIKCSQSPLSCRFHHALILKCFAIFNPTHCLAHPLSLLQVPPCLDVQRGLGLAVERTLTRRQFQPPRPRRPRPRRLSPSPSLTSPRVLQ